MCTGFAALYFVSAQAVIGGSSLLKEKSANPELPLMCGYCVHTPEKSGCAAPGPLPAVCRFPPLCAGSNHAHPSTVVSTLAAIRHLLLMSVRLLNHSGVSPCFKFLRSVVSRRLPFHRA